MHARTISLLLCCVVWLSVGIAGWVARSSALALARLRAALVQRARTCAPIGRA